MKQLEVDMRHSWSMWPKLGEHVQNKLHKRRAQLYLHHIIRHLMHLEEPIVSSPRECLALLARDRNVHKSCQLLLFACLSHSNTDHWFKTQTTRGSDKLRCYVTYYITLSSISGCGIHPLFLNWLKRSYFFLSFNFKQVYGNIHFPAQLRELAVANIKIFRTS